jgi:hypothetical protein
MPSAIDPGDDLRVAIKQVIAATLDVLDSSILTVVRYHSPLWAQITLTS